MNIFDAIKNSVLEQFVTGVTVWQMLLSLLVAFGLGLFILFIYRLTFRGVLFSKGFAFSLILITLVTAMVIRTISSNLALSLGMVGALSIVRFRTAVKDPVDTVFLFWAIAAGIMSGAGLYLIGAIACVLLGLLYFAVSHLYKKTACPYLLIVRYEAAAAQAVVKEVKKLPKSRLKSRVVSAGGNESTYEVSVKSGESKVVNALLAIPGVYDASLISYESEFGI